MEIKAYAKLKPEEIIYDPETRTVSVEPDYHRNFVPKSVVERMGKGFEGWYLFSGEVSNMSFLEVQGAKDQTEGRGGNYTAGHFDTFREAWFAAEGLGVQGTNGEIKLFIYPDIIDNSFKLWKDERNRGVEPAASGYVGLHTVLTIDANNEEAMLKGNPRYAAYLQLKAEFESDNPVSAD